MINIKAAGFKFQGLSNKETNLVIEILKCQLIKVAY